jgi:hypothetical protein
MRRLLSLAPRRVLIAAATMAFALVMFAILVPVLGGARDSAVAQGAQLFADITAAQSKLTGLSADEKYVVDHQAEYEALLAGDQLVPHTRRAAVLALTETATVHGLSGLNYSFTTADALSRDAVAAQPAGGGYTVAVEMIDLTIDAPLDGPIYRFIGDIMQTFPGSLTISSIELSRMADISAEALAAVSAGQASQLVPGSIVLSWRTAQADKTSAAGTAK